MDISKAPDFYQGYLQNSVKKGSILEAMETSLEDFLSLIKPIDEEKSFYKYAPEKWSYKDVVQHLIDSELVFAYRAMRFARNDSTILPGFEQNDYASSANADAKPWEDLIAELKSIRESSIFLFQAFDKEVLDRAFNANGYNISVEMIGYTISGHMMHHHKVIQERYLK